MSDVVRPEGLLLEIAVLGLGAMGSRMAANLLRAGHRVTVWNRSPGTADALVAAGAREATSPRRAAVDADVVIAMVRNDEASRHVWCDADTGALGGMKRGALAIDSSTLSPGWVRSLGKAAAERGVDLLEAPVAGSRPQAEAGQLVYLVGGATATVERGTPVLRAMGSAVHHVGPLGDGALAKLATNALLGIQVTALAEIIGLLTRKGADTAKVLKAMASTAAWAPVATRLTDSMLSGDYRPQFPIDLIEKDLGYAVAEAGSSDSAPTITSARDVFRQGVARGMGGDHMTGVVRLFTLG